MAMTTPTTTLVHIGDTHLHPGPRQADRLKALDQIIHECAARPDLGAWLWPGDLFHQRSTIEDRNALKDRVRQMAHCAPVLICYGNHDLPGDLDIFGDLGSVYPIRVINRPDVVRLELRTGVMASVFVLPYPTEAGLVSAGVAPGEMVRTARELLDILFIDAGAKLEAARQCGDATLMIGHVNVAGSLASTGQPQIGQEIEVDGALLARLGDCYKGVSHIHKAQSVSGAHYPGSICRLDWGERDPKGYILVELEDLSAEPSASPKWGYFVQRKPVDVAPMFHVDGTLTRDGFTADPQSDLPLSWKGCEVRVRARFLQSEKAILELAKASILAEFAEAARFELELQAIPDGGLRAPAVAAAVTLDEKLRAWATEAGVALPEAVLEALPALQHGESEQVIAEERARMDALVTPAVPAAEAVCA